MIAARQGAAKPGEARRGTARRGWARHGKARQGVSELEPYSSLRGREYPARNMMKKYNNKGEIVYPWYLLTAMLLVVFFSVLVFTAIDQQNQTNQSKIVDRSVIEISTKKLPLVSEAWIQQEEFTVFELKHGWIVKENSETSSTPFFVPKP